MQPDLPTNLTQPDFSGIGPISYDGAENDDEEAAASYPAPGLPANAQVLVAGPTAEENVLGANHFALTGQSGGSVIVNSNNPIYFTDVGDVANNQLVRTYYNPSGTVIGDSIPVTVNGSVTTLADGSTVEYDPPSTPVAEIVVTARSSQQGAAAQFVDGVATGAVGAVQDAVRGVVGGAEALVNDPLGAIGNAAKLAYLASTPTGQLELLSRAESTIVSGARNVVNGYNAAAANGTLPNYFGQIVGRGGVYLAAGVATDGIADEFAVGAVGAEGTEALAAGSESIAAAKTSQMLGGYAADEFSMTDLSAGDRVYGGLPGQSAFYTDANTLAASQGDPTSLFESLQVAPHPEFGYRPLVGEYEVINNTSVPFGQALANPTYGAGGGSQYFISNYSSNLRLINQIPLGK